MKEDLNKTSSTDVSPKASKNNHLCLSSNDQGKMRDACAFNSQLMDYLRDKIDVGVSTNEIDTLVHKYTLDHNHIPACLGYHGFPKTLCTSVNEVICHGIPDDYILKDGDIVNIDLTTVVDGWFGDQSEMFLIGNVSEKAKTLCEVAYESMMKGIEAIRPGEPMANVGIAIEAVAKPLGYGVVRDYQGHGIGRKFHQEPSVPHFKTAESMAFIVEPGMCFTVEPMINEGTHLTVLDRKDGWTVRTKDSLLSAQWEHTLLINNNGAEILTKCKGNPSIFSN